MPIKPRHERRTETDNPRSPRSQRKERGKSGPALTSGASRVIALGVLVACGAAILILLSSDVFTIRRVTVVGNHQLAAERVAELSGLIGKSLFNVNTSAVRKAIVAGTPLARDVILEYRLPNEVVVKVDEREACFAWSVAGTKYAVSCDGTVMGPCGEPAPPILVVDADGPSPAVGGVVDQAALEAVVALRDEVPRRLGFQIGEFAFSRSQGVSLLTPDGTRVVFGTAENLDGKMATLLAVLEQSRSQGRKLELVDVRFQNRPYIR